MRLRGPRSRPTTSQKTSKSREWNPDLWICSQELWPLDHRGGHCFYYTRKIFLKSLTFISSEICSLVYSQGYGSHRYKVCIIDRCSSSRHVCVHSLPHFRSNRNVFLDAVSEKELWKQKQGRKGRVGVLVNNQNSASRIPSRSRKKNWAETLQIQRKQNNCESQRLEHISYFLSLSSPNILITGIVDNHTFIPKVHSTKRTHGWLSARITAAFYLH
jgi:hypothetical protein